MNPQAIEDYALIGDCETAALVGRTGSIDWLCWPRFDSDSCFAALLGDEQHGRWRIAPAEGGACRSRSYWPSTLILETRFATTTGEIALVDFMPPRGKFSDIVRIVRGVEGTVAVRMMLSLRFDYGRVIPWTRFDPKDGAATEIRSIAGPSMTVLRTPAPVRLVDDEQVSEFQVRAGESIPFVLTYAPSHEPLPERIDPDAALEDTRSFWTGWCAKSSHPALSGRDRLSEVIKRSLITLKALTYAPTGGIVAAVTTSLPERIGGSRNWDYRYCWIRDATITLLALMNAGYHDEARCWRDWLLRATAGRPDQMQIMYGIAGERRLTEWKVPWLPGYEGSQPVRIGNAAHRQLQLDVYGELMDTLYQARCGGLDQDATAWDLQKGLLAHLEAVWREPDSGIWEVRCGPRHFTYSKVMAWVAFDRAIKSVRAFRADGPVDHWCRIRQEIYDDVCANGYDAGLKSFVQSYGSQTLDASLLLLPTLGFLPATDERFVGTVAAIERDLLRDGFVLRYDPSRTSDGIQEDEGAFLACSFWLVDAYRMLGRIEDADSLFLRLLDICNDVGLLSEEFDPNAGRQTGNTPQAFSHVALLNTAFNLARMNLRPGEEERKPVATPAASPAGP
jgi:GH15 family glucan-1,4-alpha-glucosidase